jgi:hypothetical protein
VIVTVAPRAQAGAPSSTSSRAPTCPPGPRNVPC